MQSRVLLVEDEPNAFQRCAQVIDQHPRLTLSKTATSFREAREIIDVHCDDLDLLLTDLKLGDGDGASLIRLWRSKHDRAAMVITVFGDVDSVLRAVRAGADGYVLKSGSDYEMMTAVTTVLDGGAPISAAVAGHLLREVRSENKTQKTETSVADLSEREIDILHDLAKGHSFKEVARNKLISPHTVADHVKTIYRKLAVNSRGEAVYRAIKQGLIDL